MKRVYLLRDAKATGGGPASTPDDIVPPDGDDVVESEATRQDVADTFSTGSEEVIPPNQEEETSPSQEQETSTASQATESTGEDVGAGEAQAEDEGQADQQSREADVEVDWQERYQMLLEKMDKYFAPQPKPQAPPQPQQVAQPQQQQPQQQPEKKPLVTVDDYNAALSSPEGFQQVMTNVYNRAIQDTIAQLPNVVGPMAFQIFHQARAVDDYFRQHEDLARVRNYVLNQSHFVAAEHPDWNLEQVIAEAGNRVRKELFGGKAPERINPAKKPALPAKGAGPRALGVNRQTRQSLGDEIFDTLMG